MSYRPGQIARTSLVALLVSLAMVAPATGGPSGFCLTYATDVRTADPRPLTFGVTAAGQVFSSLPERIPEDPVATMAALSDLSGGHALLVRLNRFFYGDGDAGIDHFEQLASRYTDAGYQVTLQLRYGPFRGAEDPTPEDFALWVRDVVARLGANEDVVAVEVTNEPNLGTAPDNSDGAHNGVRNALVQGVIAAADERDLRGFEQLEVGFNWFHDTGQLDERSFWSSLGATGGAAFAGALDWIGLNAYPGTYDALTTVPGGEGLEMLHALSKLRTCYLPMIGVGDATPIRVIENGYPDGFGRPEAVTAGALERMVRAVHEYAGAYNVTHHLWFTLRDTNSTALSFEHNYGLLDDDYRPKIAFERYRTLIGELSS